MSSFERRIPQYRISPQEAQRRVERHELRTILFRGWVNENGEHLNKHEYCANGYAVRLCTTNARLYDCWIPDPEEENCAVHLVVDEDDLVKRFANHKKCMFLAGMMGCYLEEFKTLPMQEKLQKLWNAIDIFEFFEMDEIPDCIPAEHVKLEKNITDDAFRVQTLDDKIVR